MKTLPLDVIILLSVLIINCFIKDVKTQEVTQRCLQCICKASSGCKLNTKCHNSGTNAYFCGPYQISWAYWSDAGKPGNTGRSDDFEHCLNDKNCAEVTVRGYMSKWATDCNNDGVVDCLDFAAIHKAGASSCNQQWLYNSQYWNVFRQCQLSSGDASPSQPALDDKPWQPSSQPQTPKPQPQPHLPDSSWNRPQSQPQPQPYPNDPYNQPPPPPSPPNDPWNKPQPTSDDGVIQVFPGNPTNPQPQPDEPWNRPQSQPKPPAPRPVLRPQPYPSVADTPQPQPKPDDSWDPIPPQPINNDNYNEPQPDPWNQPQPPAQPNPDPYSNDPYNNPSQPVTEDPWDEVSRAVDREVAQPSPKPQSQPQPTDPWNIFNGQSPPRVPGRAPTQPISWSTPTGPQPSAANPYDTHNSPGVPSSQPKPPPSPSLIEVPNNASVGDNCFDCICQASSDCDLNKQCEGSYCGPYLISWAYWSDGGQPGGDYATCANDKACAERTVQGYMNKWQRDCNGDGVVDCADFAAIHKLGPHSCNSESLRGTDYWTSYQSCQSPAIEARRLEPNPKRDSITGRSVPQSQPNANVFLEYPNHNTKPIELRAGNPVTRDAPNYYARDARIEFPRDDSPNRFEATTGPVSPPIAADNRSNERAFEALGLQRECLDCICHASSVKVKLQIWDTAGQERFRSITQSYYRSAHCLMLVYDISSQPSFDSLHQWCRDMEQYAGDYKLSFGAGASSCNQQWLYNSQYWNVFRQCQLSSGDASPSQPSQPALDDKPWQPSSQPQTPKLQPQPYLPDSSWNRPQSQPQPQPYPNDPYNQPPPPPSPPNDPWNKPQPTSDDGVIQVFPGNPTNPQPQPDEPWNRPQSQPKPPAPRPVLRPQPYPSVVDTPQPQPKPDDSWDPIPPQPINNDNYNEPQPDPWNQPQPPAQPNPDPYPNDPYNNPSQPVTEDPWDEVSRAVDREVAQPSPKPQSQPTDPWNIFNGQSPPRVPGRAPTQPISWSTPTGPQPSAGNPYDTHNSPGVPSNQPKPPPSPSLIEVPNNASVGDNCLDCICQASSDCDLNKQCEGSYCGPYLISWAYWSDGGQPGGDYATCANDKACAERTVQGYMNKWQRDCDGDGVVDCADFAAIHKLGPHSCNSESLRGTDYWTSYQSCQSPAIEARRLEPNPKRDSITGRSVPQSQPNANVFLEYPNHNAKPIELRAGNPVTRDAPNYYTRDARVVFPRDDSSNRYEATTGPVSSPIAADNRSNERAFEALGLQRECLDCIC
ncbi:unnamed protein product, partial [Medioppia subpectinata]